MSTLCRCATIQEGKTAREEVAISYVGMNHEIHNDRPSRDNIISMNSVEERRPAQIISAERLLPRDYTKSAEAQSISLSNIDSGTAFWSPAAGLWIFDSVPMRQEPLSHHLKETLQDTLASFPYFCGHLRWHPTPGDSSSGTQAKLGPPIVTWGSQNDPGVDFTVAKLDRDVVDIVASPKERMTTRQAWIGTGFPMAELHMASGTLLAPPPLGSEELRPMMTVQATMLKNGGFAITIKLPHCIADATTLSIFANHFAVNSRIRYGNASQNDRPPPPIFNPYLMQERATGNTESTGTDQDVAAEGLELPLMRSDWPAMGADASEPGPEVVPPGDIWNFNTRISFGVISFTASQITSLQTEARKSAPGASRLTSVMAHMWLAINRARGVSQEGKKTQLVVPLGLRHRTTPPLPNTYIGNAMVIPGVSPTDDPTAESTPNRIGNVAANIQACQQSFTPSAVSSMIHSIVRVKGPALLWDAALTPDLLLVSSWMHLGMNKLDFFGEDVKPRYSSLILPEIPCMFMTVIENEGGAGGLDLMLVMEGEGLRRLVADPFLIPNV